MANKTPEKPSQPKTPKERVVENTRKKMSTRGKIAIAALVGLATGPATCDLISEKPKIESVDAYAKSFLVANRAQDLYDKNHKKRKELQAKVMEEKGAPQDVWMYFLTEAEKELNEDPDKFNKRHRDLIKAAEAKGTSEEGTFVYHPTGDRLSEERRDEVIKDALSKRLIGQEFEKVKLGDGRDVLDREGRPCWFVKELAQFYTNYNEEVYKEGHYNWQTWFRYCWRPSPQQKVINSRVEISAGDRKSMHTFGVAGDLNNYNIKELREGLDKLGMVYGCNSVADDEGHVTIPGEVAGKAGYKTMMCTMGDVDAMRKVRDDLLKEGVKIILDKIGK